MFFQTGEFDVVPFPVHVEPARDNRLASRHVIAFRCVRLALHVLTGVLRAALILPFCSRPRVEQQMRRWSQQLLRILGIQVDVKNILTLLPMPGHVVVMNHISWLDVFVLNSVLPSRFVAKADVKQWPIIGFLCQQAGTLFLDRHRQRAVTDINASLRQAINNGEMVAIFPEGTTTRGNTLKPFKSALFQAAIDANTAVVPIVLHYRDSTRHFSDAPAYVGEMNLVQSILAIVSQRRLFAQLTVLPAITSTGKQRAELAESTEHAMYFSIAKLG